MINVIFDVTIGGSQQLLFSYIEPKILPLNHERSLIEQYFCQYESEKNRLFHIKISFNSALSFAPVNLLVFTEVTLYIWCINFDKTECLINFFTEICHNDASYPAQNKLV